MTAPTKWAVPYPMLGAPQGEDEIAAAAAVLRSGERLHGGRVRDRFEAELGRFLDAGLVSTTPSCTFALWAATQLLDLRDGDEVIASSLTYQATLAPLLGRRLRVRFGDVDPETLNLDPASVARLVGPATRAIIVTHYGGAPADAPALMEIARRHDLTVIEDAAHALGAHTAGRMAGTWGIGCFSFGSSKNLSSLGQGGAICVREPSDLVAEAIDRLRSIEPLADFRPVTGAPFPGYAAPADGLLRHEKNAYTHDCDAPRGSGLNGSLSEPACAAGSVQLAKLDGFIARRREIADRLDAAVAALPWARAQTRYPDTVSSHHLYSLLLTDPDVDREEFVGALAALGVEIQLRFFPLHLLPEWRAGGSGYGDCPVTEDVWFRRLVNLPIYPMLTDRQVDYMVEALPRAYRLARGHGSAHRVAAELARRFDVPPNLLPALV